MKSLFSLLATLLISSISFAQVTDPTFSPLDDATGVSLSPVLTATFDGYSAVTLTDFQNIAIRNITTSSFDIILTTNTAQVYTSGNVLTIDLSGETLNEGHEYAVYVPNLDVIDVDGTSYNELQNYTKWSFTAVEPLSDPTFSPLDNATDVSISPTLTATFDGYSSVSLTEFESIVIRNVTTSTNEYILSTSGSQVSTADNVLTIDLTGETLSGGDEYAVYVPNNDVINVDGQYYNELQNYTKWSFTTSAGVSDPTFSPLDDATEVSVSPILTATFDGYSNVTLTDFESVVIYNVTTASNDIILSTSGSEVSASGNVLTIDLSGQTLLGSNEYAIYIPNNDVIDVDGQYYNELQNYTKWSFTTAATDPTFSPLDDATGVSQSPVLTATFDGYSSVSVAAFNAVVIYNVTTASNEIILSTSGSEISTSGNVLTIDLSGETLIGGNEYAVYIPNNDVISYDGNYYNELQNYTKWSFTVVEPLTDPTFSPLDDATGVLPSPILTATFDGYSSVSVAAFKSIVVYNVTTASNEIILSTSGSEVSTSGNVLTIDLSGETLLGNNEYAIYIPSSDVVNVDGQYYNELQNYTKWSFTTTSVLTDPTFSPLDDATGVDLSPTLTATFDAYSAVSLTAFKSIVVRNITTSSNEIILSTSGSEISTSGNVLTIDLSGETLIEGNEYAIYVPNADVINVDGQYYNELQNYTKWSFTTVTPLPDPTFAPLDNATDVGTSPTLTATFEGYSTVTLSDLENVVIRNVTTSANEIILTTNTAQVSTSGNVMTIDLSGETLIEGNEYAVYIPGNDVIQVDGQYYNGLQNYTTWSFTTIDPVSDPTFSPLDDAVDVSSSPFLTATFDAYTAVSLADLENIVIYNITTSSNELILNTNSAEVYTSGNVLSIDLSGETLLAENEYAVYVPNSNIIQVDGQYYNSLQNYTQWSFTIADVSAPITSFDSPTDGQTDVSVGAPLEVSFDEAVRNLDGSQISELDLQTIVSFSPAVTFTATINAGADAITITPSDMLSPETTYTLTINQVEDILGNEQSSASSIDFTTAAFNTWTGDAGDNDFSNAANWEAGYVPGASAIIPAGTPEVIIGSNTSLPNMVIEPLGSVTINSSVLLTITEGLTLKSDATGNGSLIVDGSLTVNNSNIKIEQNISNPSIYNFISSPVQSATLTSIGSDGNIYSWNNITGSWDAYGSDTDFTPLEGYILSSTNDLLFSGAINNNSSYSITANGTPKNSGFTLAGNPFPAAIDWDLIDASDRVGIDNEFWIWLTTSQYGTYNGTTGVGTNLEGDESLIPSNHGFWIQATWESGQTVSGNLTVRKSHLAHNHTSYLKSASTEEVIPHIRLAGIHNGTKDEKVIAFSPEAAESYEAYDSKKKFGNNSDLIELYSIVDGYNLTINTYPDLVSNMIIPLCYKTSKAGTFQIALEDIQGIDENVQVLLTDNDDIITVDLTVDGFYEFTSEKTNSTTRFDIELINGFTTNTDEKPTTKPAEIYAIKKNVFIKTFGSEDANFSILNTEGKLIKQGKLNSGTLNEIQIQQTGVYIIKVIQDNQLSTKKVVIN